MNQVQVLGQRYPDNRLHHALDVVHRNSVFLSLRAGYPWSPLILLLILMSHLRSYFAMAANPASLARLQRRHLVLQWIEKAFLVVGVYPSLSLKESLVEARMGW